MRLACHLRTIRGKRSLRDIAEASGVDRGTLSRIERGQQLPTGEEQLEKIEAAYGSPVEDWYSRRALLALQEELDDDGD